MITFDIHRSGHPSSGPFLLSRRNGLLFPLSPFPTLLRLLWFHFYFRHHCNSLGRSLESSATFVRIFRRFLVASSINHVQPAASVSNVETIVGPSVDHLGPSTASVIIHLRQLRTWENVESVVRMASWNPRTVQCRSPGWSCASAPPLLLVSVSDDGHKTLTHMITQSTSRSSRNAPRIWLALSLTACQVLSTASFSSELGKSHSVFFW